MVEMVEMGERETETKGLRRWGYGVASARCRNRADAQVQLCGRSVGPGHCPKTDV